MKVPIPLLPIAGSLISYFLLSSFFPFFLSFPSEMSFSDAEFASFPSLTVDVLRNVLALNAGEKRFTDAQVAQLSALLPAPAAAEPAPVPAPAPAPMSWYNR